MFVGPVIGRDNELGGGSILPRTPVFHDPVRAVRGVALAAVSHDAVINDAFFVGGNVHRRDHRGTGLEGFTTGVFPPDRDFEMRPNPRIEGSRIYRHDIHRQLRQLRNRSRNVLRRHVGTPVRCREVDRPAHRRIGIKVDEPTNVLALGLPNRHLIERGVAELFPEVIPDIGNESVCQHAAHAMPGHDHVA